MGLVKPSPFLPSWALAGVNQADLPGAWVISQFAKSVGMLLDPPTFPIQQAFSTPWLVIPTSLNGTGIA